MIKVTSNLSPQLLKPKQRKIYLWNKADFGQLNANMMQFAGSFFFLLLLG